MQKILQDNGYYTGIIGKYSFTENPPGCNWYAVRNNIAYINPDFYINGVQTPFTGHVSDVYTELIATFFKSIPTGKKFMLFFWPVTPHGPTIPRDADKNIYLQNSIPLPSNSYKYEYNYPDYYYNPDHNWNFSISQTDSLRRIEYQTQQGCDMNVDTIIKRLEKINKLDSTLLIFTSDNGFIKGEHLIKGKEIALEESIRLPLFIRYPKWFTTGSIVDNEIVSNFDLPVTILDAAKIPNTYNMNGLSLRSVYSGAAQRKDLLYEFCGSGKTSTPSLRAVRGLQYVYVKTYCKETTEEFYDLSVDANQNTNQIFNASYATLVAQYRFKLDSLRTVFNDIQPIQGKCALKNIQQKMPSASHENNKLSYHVFPNPADNYFTVELKDNAPARVAIFDCSGLVMAEHSVDGAIAINVRCGEWPEGYYLIKITGAEETSFLKLIVSR